MPGGPPIGVGDDVLGEPKRYYSAKDLANLGREVGWRDDGTDQDGSIKWSSLQVAVAVALAESGGDSRAVGPTVNGENAYGLWQIYPGSESLFDAHRNAEAAYAKWKAAGNTFTPWSVFNSKAYLVKLPAAALAVKSTHRDRPGFTGGGTGAVHDLIAFTGNIGHDVAAFFAWITSGQTWLRLGEVLAGAILFLLALYLLFTHTQVGKDVRSVATKGAM